MESGLTKLDLKEFLDNKYEQYNQKVFIESDPIQIPHDFKLKQDIEIAAFLTSTIAWGQRKTIIKNAKIMMENEHTEQNQKDTGVHEHEIAEGAEREHQE